MKLQNAINKAEKVLNTKVVETDYCYQFFYKAYVLELYSYRGVDGEMYFTMPVVRLTNDKNDPRHDYFAGSTYKNLKKALEAIVEKGDKRQKECEEVQFMPVAQEFQNEEGEFTFIPFKSTFVNQIDVMFKGRRVAIINGIDGALLRFVKNDKAEEMSIAQIEWLENYAYRFLDFNGLVPADEEEESYEGGVVYEYDKSKEEVILTFEEGEEIRTSGREFFELAQGMGFFDNASGFGEDGVTVSFEVRDRISAKFRYYNDLVLANIFEDGQFIKLALEVKKIQQRDTVPAGSKIEWTDVKLSGFPTVVMGKSGVGKSFFAVHMIRETVIRHLFERTCPADRIFKINNENSKIESFTYLESNTTSYQEVQHTYLNEKGEKVSVPNRWIDNETFYFDSELKVNQKYLQWLEFEKIMTEDKIKKLQ